MTISCAEGEECDGRRQKLAVSVSGADPNITPTFKWCISAGTLVSGQGTTAIEIDAGDVNEEKITVVLMFGGADKLCNNVASYSLMLPKKG